MKKATLLAFLSVTMLMVTQNIFAQEKPSVPVKKTKSSLSQKLDPGGPRTGGGQGGSQPDTLNKSSTHSHGGVRLDSLHHSKMKKIKVN